MKGKTIAEHMIDIMKENNRTGIWYGDLDELHECARRSGMYDKNTKNHPILILNRVLSALDRSNKFNKFYIKHRGRPARSFKLKEEFR